jgi:hypothetical protein
LDELEGKISQTRWLSKVNVGINWLAFDLSLTIPSWPLYIDGQVSRIGWDPTQITISIYDMNSYFD